MRIAGKAQADATERGKPMFCVFGSDNGAITVEYVMTMVVAGLLMTGIALLFNNMSIQVINRIKTIVISFPNI